MSDQNPEKKSELEPTQEVSRGESLDYPKKEALARDAVKAYYENFRKEQGEIDDEVDKKIKDPFEGQEVKEENKVLGKEVAGACIDFDDEIKQKTRDDPDGGRGIEQKEEVDDEKVPSAESSEQVFGGVESTQKPSSEPGNKENVAQPSEDEEGATKKPAIDVELKRKKAQEYINNTHTAEQTTGESITEGAEAGAEGEDILTEDEAVETADAMEETEKHFFGEGGHSEDAQTLIDEFERAKKEDAENEDLENNETPETDKVIAQTGKKYAEELKLPLNYKDDVEAKKEIVKAEKEMEKKLMDAELIKGMEKGEINLASIIDEGLGLLREGTPEQVKTYFENIAETFDDSAKHMQYMYARMEGDPEMKESLKKDYITLVTNIQEFKETSAIMKELAGRAEKAQEKGVSLSDADIKEMSSLLNTLKKAAVVIAALSGALYRISQYSAQFAVAHPTIANVVRKSGFVAGAKVTASVIPATVAAKGMFWIAAFVAVWKEKKRDDFVQALFQFKLPAILTAPTKAEAAKK
ncbi:MAG: hypothetical protein PHX30_04630 [Candidatus Pacebacteria bacterium]|nr:hypothetical protein [Candidatus Paceibacterota bacterium]